MKTHRPRRSPAELQSHLLDWFRKHCRDLPWRRSRDPYRIWIAEVMLQQTRIAAVLPYYDRFLRRFPDIEALARARQDSVLKFWSGLGYYSRARNLHRAARRIVARYHGQFPAELDIALKLPGIGRYTAAAVLSIAYNVPLAVLDGNVARVLARLDAIQGDLRAPKRWKELAARAQDLLARDAPGDWNQSLMELGETICTPRAPCCDACPISRACLARKLNLTAEIPAPRKKQAAVRQKIAAAILRDPFGRTLLVEDPGAHDEVLFSRMWQFPALEVSSHPREELAEHLRVTLALGDTVCLEPLPQARHGVTYRNITLLPFLALVARLPHCARTHILPLSHLTRASHLPVSSATRKIAAAVAHHQV